MDPRTLGPSVEFYGATNRVRGVPKSVAVTHAACACATGAFGGAPCGATTRVRGVMMMRLMWP